MIAEAVDAALELWLWFIAGAAVASLAFLGMVAAGWAVCRMLRRAWGAVGPRTDSLGPLAAEQSDEAREAPGAPDRHTGPRWARDDQEAA